MELGPTDMVTQDREGNQVLKVESPEGRKWILLMSWFGRMLADIYGVICLYFWYEINGDWIIFQTFSEIFGGKPAFFMGVYAYISDLSSGERPTCVETDTYTPLLRHCSQEQSCASCSGRPWSIPWKDRRLRYVEHKHQDIPHAY